VQFNVSETMCSLAFAQRVRAVELGAASKCLDSSSDKGSRRERLDQNDVGVSVSCEFLRVFALVCGSLHVPPLILIGRL